MRSSGLSNLNKGYQIFGITEPISLAGPTENDVIKTRELEKVLFAIFCIHVDFGASPCVFFSFRDLDSGCSVLARC